MTNTSEEKNSLSQTDRRRLLLELLRERAKEPQAFPLSFSQQRLWFLDERDRGNQAYNMIFALKFALPLNIQALFQSLTSIVLRHQTFRTTFTSKEGIPLQKIASSIEVHLPVIDLQGLPLADERDEIVQTLAQEARMSRFDLRQGPLFQTYLVKLAPHESALILLIHHILFDGWSLGVFCREIEKLYRAFASGQTSPLADLPIQYTDFALWQRQRRQGERFRQQLDYWRKQLANVSELTLPLDNPRPQTPTSLATSRLCLLPPDLTMQLRNLCQQERTTLFMLLLAAFQTLLYRYTGQDDIVIGTNIAGRIRKEFEGLIGLFLNALVIRTDFSGEPTFMEILRRVRKQVIEAYDNQEVPFEKVVEELHPQRDANRHPLYQVTFTFQDFRFFGAQSAEISYYPLRVEEKAAKVDIAVASYESADGLYVIITYNKELFEASTIDRILTRYALLLETIGADPQRHVSGLSLLIPDERHLLLKEWNATQIEVADDRCLHELFTEQVERAPDAIAVVSEDMQLSYQALNRYANQLAHILQAQGVKPETPVGVFVERSLSTLICLLAILKAGGCYVPLDPSYPHSYLNEILSDIRLPVLLTKHDLLGQLPSLETSVICLDNVLDASALTDQNWNNPVTTVMADNLFYIIYTSGSTGAPKGVAVPQRQLLNRFAWMWRVYPFEEGERVCQRTPMNFTVSIWEFLGPLLRGIPIVIFTDPIVKDVSQFILHLSISGITHVVVVPSLLRVMLEIGDGLGVRLKDLKLWSVGGEALSSDLVQQFSERLPHARLINQYGASELNDAITIDTSLFQREHTNVSIGRPIDNLRVYLLDSSLNLTPIGIPGEMYIESIALARGYHNRPDLTAERFLPNPFSRQPGSRLYRTGDLARYRADGELEYLGRNDSQVKVRGMRADLAGLETVLSKHKNIKQTIVLTMGEKTAENQLVAYVVPRQEALPDADELRDFVKKRLPEFMVPSVFVFLNAIPLTPNGKVNRRALPTPRTVYRTDDEPGNQLERVLAELWAEVLGRERVGIYENFFDLGGHSLQGVQLAYRISMLTNKDVSVNFIFQHPTIGELARKLEELPASEVEQKVVQFNSDNAGPGSSMPPAEDSKICTPSSDYIKLERRPLHALIMTGEIEPVQSAALCCLPHYLPQWTGMTQEELVAAYDHLPSIGTLAESPLGRIAVITIPRFETSVYSDKKSLLTQINSAIRFAAQLGASNISLMGLLASATNYGQDLAPELHRQGLPTVSTGHGTTISSIVLASEYMLNLTGRNLAQESLGVLGLGSIGSTTLRLLLTCVPHPAEIYLCDLYSKREELARIREELLGRLNFKGEVHVVETHREVPTQFYNSTFIIGATNVPDVLDVRRLRSGTLIVDDTVPHCFDPGIAIERLENEQDLLFTTGGVLSAPQPLKKISYIPRFLEQAVGEAQVEASKERNPRLIGSCTLSSLLSVRFTDLAPTIGLIEPDTALLHYKTLKQLGYQAAPVHCGNYEPDLHKMEVFKSRFGFSAQAES